MNWLNRILPPDKQGAPAAPRSRRAAAAPAPLPDIGQLRLALGASLTPEERAQRTRALGRALGQLRSAPLGADGNDVWAATICAAADEATGLQWLAQCDGDELLGEVACHARFAGLRLAAAVRIGEDAVLERVAQHSRNRDRGVYRHCTGVLRRRRHAGDSAQHARELAHALRALLESAPVSVTHLLELERELHGLGDAGDALAECAGLIEQASLRIRLEAEELRRVQSLAVGASNLRMQIPGAGWPGTAQVAQWRERCGELRRERSALARWLESHSAVKFLDASLQEADGELDRLEQDAVRLGDCEQALERLAGGPADEAAAAAWEALPKPAHRELAAALRERWRALAAAPTPAPPAPAQDAAQKEPKAAAQPRLDPAQVEEPLKELERAIDEGQLAAAEAAARQLKAMTEGHSGLRSVDARLQRAHARLGELRGWAQWGASKKREDLVAAAEELGTGASGIEQLAVAVPALREQWKQLNAQGPAGKGQWEKFDAALTKAFAPVLAQRAQEAERRAQAAAQKKALLAGFEAAIAAIDWEHADYAAIEAQRLQFQGRWRSAPHAGFREERAMRKRWDGLLREFEGRLDAARAGEVARREELIAQAIALAQTPDLRHAMHEAKALQERWRAGPGAPRLARGAEQKLWQRFRAACDAVFARRDTQRAEDLAHREQRSQARTALLDGLAQALGETDTRAIERALGQFRRDWESMRASAGAAGEGQERRARELQHQGQQRCEALRRQLHRQRLEQLAQQAPAAQGLDAQALAQGHAARLGLLLDMEMALELPSPPEFADARRRRKLEQLQNRFQSGPQRQAPPEELLARYHATAASADPASEARVAAIVQTLVQRHEEKPPRK